MKKLECHLSFDNTCCWMWTLSSIFVGFKILEEKGLLKVKSVSMDRNFRADGRYPDRMIVELKADGKTIAYDMSDGYQSILCRSFRSMKYMPIIQITMHSMSMPAMSTPQLFHLIHEDACESQISCALWFFGTLAVAPWESGYVTYGPWPRFTMTNVPSTPAGYFG